MLKFLFAWRYFRAKKTTNAINIISWISVLAITIGTASLILVLSVFNGFEGLVKSLYSSFYPDLKVSPAFGKTLVLTAEQIAQIRKVKGVQAVSMVYEEKAMLQNHLDQSTEEDDSTATGASSDPSSEGSSDPSSDHSDYQSVIYLKGVDSNYTKVTTVAEHMVDGDFRLGTDDRPLLVLGVGIESAVGVEADRNVKPLSVYMARKGEINTADPMQSLSAEAVNTSGAFVIQQDFDNKYAITNLDFVRRMLNAGKDEYSAAEISVSPGTNADESRDLLSKMLGKQYRVQNRFQQNASLYSVMNIEKWIIYAILSLILVVASFNMVGALTMLVLEKKKDISILHSLGASGSFIRGIFLGEGLLLGIIGGGSGIVLALILAYAQEHYHLIKLEGSTFMIEYFPVKLVASDFLLVSLTVLVIALIASWVPARKASRQQYLIREE